MAVTPTTTFNHLMFGSIDSADYGIYISGPAAYNAPKRAYELVAVPGRNGEIVVDQGHWENIAVTYDCGTFAKNRTEFSRAVANFRNAIASQVGYQRLTDTYNPDEYRMGLYAEGIEVEAVNMNTAGQFSVTFNCKPQRWLTSGEAAISITSGVTLMNPTLFDAKPLIKAIGKGTMTINGQEISIIQKELGRVEVAPAQEFQDRVTSRTITINGDLLLSGDAIDVSAEFKVEFCRKYSYEITAIAPDEGTGALTLSDFGLYDNWKRAFASYSFRPQLTKGTSESDSETVDVIVTWDDGSPNQATCSITCAYSYDGDSTITLTYSTVPANPDLYWSNIMTLPNRGYSINETMADSTRLSFTDPIYIDLDIGEAYTYVGGEIVSLNSQVALGSDLPVLKPGSNTISYDNTITSLNIEPRWWQL